MRAHLQRALDSAGGAAHRDDISATVTPRVLDRAVGAGLVVRLFPRVYADAALAAEPRVLRRAAVAATRGRGALSHLSALDLWDLPVPEAALSRHHVSVPEDCHIRGDERLVVHRRRGFTNAPPHAVTRDGLDVVRLDRAVVESWPLLQDEHQRAPAILAVRQRLTLPSRLLQTARDIPNLPGSASLSVLLGLLADGCHSELEIWGCLHVFWHPSLPEPRRQVPVRLGSRTIYLDSLYEEELVNVELDGAAYHSSAAQRERDIRRDAALARRGIQVVRYSPLRMRTETDAVRAEFVEVLEVRRQQLRAA